MATITAETAAGTVTFECETGGKLVLCLEDNGVDILHRCGGNARCTTCRVEVIEGEMAEMREPEQMVLATKEDLAREVGNSKAELTREIGNTKAELTREIGNTKAEVIKWMFVFWVGQALTTFGLILLFLKK